MKFFILLLNVAWLVLTAAEPAHAGPLAALASVISTAIAGAGAITKIVLGLVFNVAVSLLQKALTKTPQQKAIGVKLDIQIGDDIPVSTVIGYYPTAGKRNYVQTWGEFRKTPNAMISQVVELGNLPMSKTALQDLELWIDDQKVTVLTGEAPDENGYPIKEFRDDDDRDGDVGSGIDDYAWIKFYNGTQTTTDPFLMEKFGDLEDRPWLSSMIGRGVPYAIMTYRYRPKYFNTVPEALFVSRGIPLYDIRKDSTNGGSGPQRWDDQSTWEPSVNAVVLTYNVVRGLRYENEWFFGGQNLAASRLPASNWIAAANEAGRLIEIPGTQTEPQFRAGLEITGDMVPLQVVDTLREAANARIAEVGGVFKIQVGAFGAAVFSFTDADIEITKGQTFEPFPTLDKTVNQINISYPNPEEKWVTKDAPALSAKSIIDDATGKSLFEIDGNRVLPADVQLPAVPFPRQAQRIRRAMIKEERRFRTHRFWLPPEAWVLEPNDVIAWTSLRNGYVNKKFIVVEIQGEVTMNQMVTIREIDPADYDWSPTFELPFASGYLGTMPVPAQPMEGWTVTATTILDASGLARRPAIRVTAAANLDDVRNVWVKVRLKETGAIVFDSDQQLYAAPYAWILSGVWLLPATEYEAQGRLLRNSLSVETEPSAWLPVTTDDIRFSTQDLHLQEISQAIGSELAALEEWVWRDTNIRKLIEDRKALALGISEQDLANYSDKKQLRRELVSQAGKLRARFQEQIDVATSDTKALAQRVTTFEAELEDKASASVVETTIARVTAAEGSISSLSADMMTLATSLSDKIGSTVFSSLVSEVSQIGDVITLQGDIINEIELELDDKASFEALSVLTGTVTQQGETITTQGEAILGIRSTVGSAIAQSRMRFETVNANGSGYALAAIQTRFGTADDYRSAGMFFKTYSDPSKPPEVIVNAGLFAVAVGNDETGTKIFAVDAGGLYIDAGYIRNITTDKITFLDNSVLTSALAQEAAMSMPTFSMANSFPHTTGTSQIGFLSVTKTARDSVRVAGDVRVRITDLGGNPKVDVTVEIYWGAQFLGDATVSFDEQTPLGKTIAFGGTIISGAGTQNLQLLISSDRPSALQIGRRTMTAIVGKKVLPPSA
ncbi:phage tail protein [Rhizobium sp. NFR03]|uniref:phage tail protein n=1 Tax=Rhizobium sp. NFR03 TaxID=1566263 RepID=UPI0008C5C4A3|nr:phage tail protein [Rhizobium sp. NFR03]SER57501.1 Putative phage tail protein [Rhizobium sp. NFR03]